MHFLTRFWNVLSGRPAALDMPLPIRRGPADHVGGRTKPQAAAQVNLGFFRQVAKDARYALGLDRTLHQGLRSVNGVLESDTNRERIRLLAIPVRRAYLPSDPTNMDRMIALMRADGTREILAQLDAFDHEHAAVREALDSHSRFGDRRLAHRVLFETWIDAQVFPEQNEKTRPYEQMRQELGPSVEGIGLELAERIAGLIVQLDAIVAYYLTPSAKGRAP